MQVEMIRAVISKDNAKPNSRIVAQTCNISKLDDLPI